MSLSTLADEVGGRAGPPSPLVKRIRGHVLAGERVHGDDTRLVFPVRCSNHGRYLAIWRGTKVLVDDFELRNVGLKNSQLLLKMLDARLPRPGSAASASISAV